MNKAVSNAKNWPEQKKRPKLRVIDRGTSYDTVGQMTRMMRKVQSGKHGELRGFAVSWVMDSGSKIHFINGCYGPASMSELITAARSLAKHMESE
jgi:hypothetical protein